MAFSITSWQAGVDHLAGRLRQHHYQTVDEIALVVASGYFNTVAKQLVQGDHIEATLVNTAVPVTGRFMVTSATAATPVTVVQAP